MGVDQLLDAALDGDGIGGTFLRADLASHARRHLHRSQHHPRAGTLVARYGGEQLVGLCWFALSRGTCHIQAAHGTQIHTNTTIDTCLLIDLKTIGHADLLSAVTQRHARLSCGALVPAPNNYCMLKR